MNQFALFSLLLFLRFPCFVSKCKYSFIKFSFQDPKYRRSLGLNALADTSSSSIELKLFIGGAEIVPSNIREINAMKARFMASKMLGKTSKFQIRMDLVKIKIFSVLHISTCVKLYLANFILSWLIDDLNIKPLCNLILTTHQYFAPLIGKTKTTLQVFPSLLLQESLAFYNVQAT